MFSSVQQEWERPNPDIDTDPGDIIIPSVPYDDNTSPDCDQPDDWEEDED